MLLSVGRRCRLDSVPSRASSRALYDRPVRSAERSDRFQVGDDVQPLPPSGI